MPRITDAQEVAEACHEALTAALQAVRADAELRPDADTWPYRPTKPVRTPPT